MRELVADLWEVPAFARVITTNGTVRKDGKLVMGRGCAYEATLKYTDIAKRLGAQIQQHGLHVVAFDFPDQLPIIAFPVKYNYWELADLSLIYQSTKELVEITDFMGWTEVVMPRPGCGNGHRDWEHEVLPIARLMLDDRFVVVHKE